MIGSLFENGIEKPTTGGGGTVESILPQKGCWVFRKC